MLSERQARELIRAAWSNWDGRTGGASDRAAFYDWLMENRPQLLRFHTAGDKKRLVISWLAGV